MVVGNGNSVERSGELTQYTRDATIYVHHPISLLRRVLIQLFSFETVFVAFLFAGLLKEDSRFGNLPIDLTVAAVAVNMLQGFYIAFSKNRSLSRYALTALTLLLVFVTWVLLSLVWTPSEVYGPDKAARIALLGVWAFVGAAFVIGGDLKRIQRFYTAVLLFSTWMAVESIILYFSISPRGALATFGGHYIGIGRTLGLGICIALVWFVTGKHLFRRLVCLALVIAFVFVIMVAGARGPVLATLLALLVPVLNVRGLLVGYANRLYWRYLLVGAALLAGLLVAAATIISSDDSTATIRRFEVLFTQEGGGSSASGRTWRFEHAIDQAIASPVIGGGIGSFPVNMGAADVREYPHNIVLELLAELGIVGFTLWLVPYLLVLWRLSVQGMQDLGVHSGARVLAIMFLVSAVANAMISGDIDSNRMTYVSLGLVTGVTGRRK